MADFSSNIGEGLIKAAQELDKGRKEIFKEAMAAVDTIDKAEREINKTLKKTKKKLEETELQLDTLKAEVKDVSVEVNDTNVQQKLASAIEKAANAKPTKIKAKTQVDTYIDSSSLKDQAKDIPNEVHEILKKAGSTKGQKSKWKGFNLLENIEDLNVDVLENKLNKLYNKKNFGEKRLDEKQFVAMYTAYKELSGKEIEKYEELMSNLVNSDSTFFQNIINTTKELIPLLQKASLETDKLQKGMSASAPTSTGNLQKENNDLKERISLLKEIASSYDNIVSIEDQMNETNEGTKKYENLESSLEVAEEKVRDFESTYSQAIVYLNDGSKINIPLDEEFSDTVGNILRDASKIKDIKMITPDLQKAIKGYEILEKVLDRNIAKNGNASGTIKAGDIRTTTRAFNDIKDCESEIGYLQTAIENIKAQDPSGMFGDLSSLEQAENLLAKLRERLVELKGETSTPKNLEADASSFIITVSQLENYKLADPQWISDYTDKIRNGEIDLATALDEYKNKLAAKMQEIADEQEQNRINNEQVQIFVKEFGDASSFDEGKLTKYTEILNQISSGALSAADGIEQFKKILDSTSGSVSGLDAINEYIRRSEEVFGAKKATNIDELYEMYQNMKVYQRTIEDHPGTEAARDARRFQEEIVALNPQLERLLNNWEKLTKRKFKDVFGGTFESTPAAPLPEESSNIDLQTKTLEELVQLYHQLGTSNGADEELQKVSDAIFNIIQAEKNLNVDEMQKFVNILRGLTFVDEDSPILKKPYTVDEAISSLYKLSGKSSSQTTGQSSTQQEVDEIIQKEQQASEEAQKFAKIIAENFGVTSKTVIEKLGLEIDNVLTKLREANSTNMSDDEFDIFMNTPPNYRSILDILAEDANVASTAIGNTFDSYDKLREYVSKSVIKNDPTFKSEFGDDWLNVRNTIGSKVIKNNQGTDIMVFLQELNDVLGTTFDVSGNAADGIRQLYEALSKGKQEKISLVSDTLINNGSLGYIQSIIESNDQEIASNEEVVASEEKKRKYRVAARENIPKLSPVVKANQQEAQSSTETADTVVADEKKKQDAYDKTAKKKQEEADATKNRNHKIIGTVDSDNMWSKTYQDETGRTFTVGERLNKKTNEWESFYRELTSYTKFENEAISVINRLADAYAAMEKAKRNGATTAELDAHQQLIDYLEEEERLIRKQAEDYFKEQGLGKEYTEQLFDERVSKKTDEHALKLQIKTVQDIRKEKEAAVKVTQREQKEIERSNSFLARQERTLSNIQQLYDRAVNPNAQKGITDAADLKDLRDTYSDIVALINSLKGKTLTSDVKDDLLSKINDFENKRKSYTEKWYGATDLSPKELSVNKDILTNNFDEFISSAKLAGNYTSDLVTRVEAFKKSINSIQSSTGLKAAKDQLMEFRSEFSALKKEQETYKKNYGTIDSYAKAQASLNKLYQQQAKNGTSDELTAKIDAQKKKVAELKQEAKDAALAIIEMFKSGSISNKQKTKAVRLLRGVNAGKDESTSLLSGALNDRAKEHSEEINNVSKQYEKLGYTVEEIVEKLKDLKAAQTEVENASNNSVQDRLEKELKYQEELDKLQTETAQIKSGIKPNDSSSVINALNNTEQLMSQFANINVTGFDRVFTNAQSKVEELNKSLQTGKISTETYAKRIQDIATDLSNVIQVINPNNITQAEVAMRQYASSFKNAEIKKFNDENGRLTFTYEKQKGVIKEVTLQYDQMTGAISKIKEVTTTAQTGVQSFLSSLKKRGKALIEYLATFASFYRVVAMVRQGITVIRELDTAFTEMRKVSDESVSSLKEFQKVSFDVASTVGVTAKQIQESAADFMRLGYELKTASALAKDANIYANVGDMEIGEATEHMISSIQAWKSEFSNEVEASAAIIDRYNEIGNNFAITSADIGSAMERSAAALKAGGNTLNEALGLITAGNLIQQDADTTANALKVLSLRIRGSKTDLEEMGESTDDLASSTSKLREEIKALTGVDIMLDENTYKSTAQIITEIGAVWDKLSDVQQANTLEKLAGELFCLKFVEIHIL